MIYKNMSNFERFSEELAHFDDVIDSSTNWIAHYTERLLEAIKNRKKLLSRRDELINGDIPIVQVEQVAEEKSKQSKKQKPKKKAPRNEDEPVTHETFLSMVKDEDSEADRISAIRDARRRQTQQEDKIRTQVIAEEAALRASGKTPQEISIISNTRYRELMNESFPMGTGHKELLSKGGLLGLRETSPDDIRDELASALQAVDSQLNKKQ